MADGELRPSDLFVDQPAAACHFCGKRIGQCQNIRHDDDGVLIFEDSGASSCGDCGVPMHRHCSPFWSPGDCSSLILCGRPDCRATAATDDDLHHGSSSSSSSPPPPQPPSSSSSVPGLSALEQLCQQTASERLAAGAGPTTLAQRVLATVAALAHCSADVGDAQLLDAWTEVRDSSALLWRGAAAGDLLRAVAAAARQQMHVAVQASDGDAQRLADQLNLRVRSAQGVLAGGLKSVRRDDDGDEQRALLHCIVDQAVLQPVADGFRHLPPSLWHVMAARLAPPALTLLTLIWQVHGDLDQLALTCLSSFQSSSSSSFSTSSSTCSLSDEEINGAAVLFLLSTFLARAAVQVEAVGKLPMPVHLLSSFTALVDAAFAPVLLSLRPDDDLSPPALAIFPLRPALRALTGLLTAQGRCAAVESFLCAALVHANPLHARLAVDSLCALIADSPAGYQRRLLALVVALSRAVASRTDNDNDNDDDMLCRWSAALAELLAGVSPQQRAAVRQSLLPAHLPSAEAPVDEALLADVRLLRIGRAWSPAWLAVCNQLIARILRPLEQRGLVTGDQAPPHVVALLACLDSLLANSTDVDEALQRDTCESVLLALSFDALRRDADALWSLLSLAGRLAPLLCRQPESLLFPLLASVDEASAAALLLIERLAESLAPASPSAAQVNDRLGRLFIALLSDADWLTRSRAQLAFYRFAAALPAAAAKMLPPTLKADFVRFLSKRPVSLAPTLLDPACIRAEQASRRRTVASQQSVCLTTSQQHFTTSQQSPVQRLTTSQQHLTTSQQHLTTSQQHFTTSEPSPVQRLAATARDLAATFDLLATGTDRQLVRGARALLQQLNAQAACWFEQINE